MYYFFNVFILFNTVSYIKLYFKLKIEKNMLFKKPGKKSKKKRVATLKTEKTSNKLKVFRNSYHCRSKIFEWLSMWFCYLSGF